jgi:exodeoxyribonuclease VII large subunit
MQNITFTPSDFVGLLNQTLEVAYPLVVIEGELSSFRVSKNRWVYFDLKDEAASVAFFGSVYQLPGPLEDGMTVRVLGTPRLHPRFGFSVSFQSITPVGEGTLRKAAELLAKKLESEGLFANERKRALPQMPEVVGLITAASSAAYSDFIKIINERWGGLEVRHIDVHVQGEQAPPEIIAAIETFNQSSKPPEVIVLTRGGGSADDLAAFNDERVVRAVAASRVPILVAIGHEVDVSLAELAADMRASTPTQAAGLVVPDRIQEMAALEYEKRHLAALLGDWHQQKAADLTASKSSLISFMNTSLKDERAALESIKAIARLLDPKAALARGYAIVSLGGRHIASTKEVKLGQNLDIDLSDGRIRSTVKEIT